jgi:hypothetical protein
MSTNSLGKLEEEIARKHKRLAELRHEAEIVEKDFDQLQRAASLLHRIPDASAEDLEAALNALRGLGKTEQARIAFPTESTARSETNGKPKESAADIHRSLNDAPPKDLRGKTMTECAEAILKDHPGESLHYSAILKTAIARGYTSNRKNSDAKKVERSFAQTLTKESRRKGVVERTGEGMFRIRAKAKADAE